MLNCTPQTRLGDLIVRYLCYYLLLKAELSQELGQIELAAKRCNIFLHIRPQAGLCQEKMILCDIHPVQHARPSLHGDTLEHSQHCE